MSYDFDDERQGQFAMQQVIPGSDNICEDQKDNPEITTEAVDIVPPCVSIVVASILLVTKVSGGGK